MNMKKAFIFLLQPILMAVFVFILKPGSAGNKHLPQDYHSSNADTMNSVDEKFLVASAENSLEEIMFSQLAQQNSMLTEIKELAKTIGSTQTNNLNKIKAFASKGHVIVPSVLNEQSNKVYKKLGNKMSSEFDKEYTDWLVTNYKEIVAQYETETLDSGDDEIKSWALTSLTELRSHLEQAIQCQKKCNKM
jgi:putative membrane protein